MAGSPSTTRALRRRRCSPRASKVAIPPRRSARRGVGSPSTLSPRLSPSTPSSTSVSAVSWCVGRAILERSPCDGIRAPTIEETRDRVLTDVELASVLLAARAMGGPYGAIVEMLALTGQRREEVARMTWAEVDLVRRLWTLPGTRTKNGKPHAVQLSLAAVAVIHAQQRFSTLVFPAGGGRAVSQFSIEKRRLVALSGVLGWRLPGLRRTMVSGMACLG